MPGARGAFSDVEAGACRSRPAPRRAGVAFDGLVAVDAREAPAAVAVDGRAAARMICSPMSRPRTSANPSVRPYASTMSPVALSVLTVTFVPDGARRAISAVASGPPQSRRFLVSGADTPRTRKVTSVSSIETWTVSPSTTRVSVPVRPRRTCRRCCRPHRARRTRRRPSAAARRRR